jgi:hypothetical protein
VQAEASRRDSSNPDESRCIGTQQASRCPREERSLAAGVPRPRAQGQDVCRAPTSTELPGGPSHAVDRCGVCPTRRRHVPTVVR